MTGTHLPLGDVARLASMLAELAATIDARADADPESSWTARLLSGGPEACAKKLGEEGVEAAIAVAAQSDEAVAAEAADLIYHLMVALRSRGVPLDQVADVLEARQGQSGIEEKSSRNTRND